MKAKRTEAGGGTYRYVWQGLRSGSIGDPIFSPGAANATFQVFGEFGVDGEVILEGSCEEPAKTNCFFVLRDQGDALVRFRKPGGAMLFPVVTSLRPRVPRGDSETSLTVVLLVRSK